MWNAVSFCDHNQGRLAQFFLNKCSAQFICCFLFLHKSGRLLIYKVSFSPQHLKDLLTGFPVKAIISPWSFSHALRNPTGLTTFPDVSLCPPSYITWSFSERDWSPPWMFWSDAQILYCTLKNTDAEYHIFLGLICQQTD